MFEPWQSPQVRQMLEDPPDVDAYVRRHLDSVDGAMPL